jgi:hypothetical protein
LTFVFPCITSISVKYNQQDATFSRSIYFYKLLCMFQAVPPPIIKSTKLYIQRQVFSKQYCCLLLSWMRWNAVLSHPVYFLKQSLQVLSIFVAHHLEVYCICTKIGTICAFQLTVFWTAGRSSNRQSTEKHNKYQLLYIYSIPPDDGLQISPKYVEVV